MLQAALRDAGFYSTEGRLALLGVLRASRKPLSVPAIAARVDELDEVNVYRALEALTERGLLLRSDVRRGGAHYEFMRTGHHHHHLVCDECGDTEDVAVCDDKDLERKVLRRARRFAAIQTHALEFFGRCNMCARKNV